MPKVCETHNRRALAGKIGLQVPIKQGDIIAFRNIRIKPLEPTEINEPPVESYYRNAFAPPLKPLFQDNSLEGWYTQGDAKWEFRKNGDLYGHSGKNGGIPGE